MGPISGVVVYILSWWCVFFCVLPFGVRSHLDDMEPEDIPDVVTAGAPQKAMMKQKLIITSVIALIITVIIYFIIKSDVISFHDMAVEEMAADGELR